MLDRVNRERLLVGLAAGALAALAVVGLSGVEAFRAFEARTGDLRLRAERTLAGGGIADSSIVIVDVDNRSLRLYRDRLGRWPWPRSAYAAILDLVSLGGPRTIAFDFLLAEPDRAGAAADSALLAAVAEGPSTIHAAVFDDPLAGDRPEGGARDEAGGAGENGAGDERVGAGENGAGETDGGGTGDETGAGLARFALPFPEPLPAPIERAAPDFAAVDAPLPGLLARAAGVGAINRSPDPDGVARRERLFARHDGRVYPAMALAVALGGRAGYGRLGVAEGRPTLDDRPLPLEDGRLRLHWRGAYGDRPYRVVPAWEVLNAYARVARGGEPELDPATFAGRDVLLGSSATGVGDLFPGPFAAAEPGVFLHATLLDTVRSRDFLRAPPGRLALVLTILVILLAGLACARARSAVGAVAVLVALVATVTAADLLAFLAAGWLLPWAAPVVGAVLAWGAAMAGNYLTEGRRHRATRSAFGKFIPSDVVEAIAAEGDRVRRRVERKELTILFSDVRNFTALAEEMEPEGVVETLNEYLTATVDAVFQHRGTLDKYMGDGVMAFFGAPLDDPDHALHACRAALAVRLRLEALNEKWKAEDRPCLSIGIGVHTGEVVVGFIGDESRRMDYTVVGDAVNLASRLEGLNKECGTTILISGETASRLAGRLPAEPLGERTVRGRREPVRIYTLPAE